ncbi:MAG: Hsp33 family molecular chaperone HslO [Candidatus Accumulibacter sp.]|uniref:Hsp33 family molecular chaperone HslO n=1 Tax=Accumulibacter sp. TaxID=2053492 RepID=UPI0028786B42|nr:Hsp33 family molecular chaperone HslO [Accumulibacter sp.]MDS4014443.1 Hsp33 family molecular chaperone HslO [Accumulibacter sp.]
MPEHDFLHRFLFEQLAVRGEIVQLDTTWQTVLARRAYPPAIRRVLGEASAAAALLAATIKFAGRLTLQIQSAGPLRLLVVQVTSERTLRALARWEGEPETAALNDLCAGGRLILTLDPGLGREPHQGVVSLDGDTLASALETYFARSEQLPTRFQLAADERVAAGLLLQRMPETQSKDPDGWNRLATLAATLRPAELLELEPTALLHRLFHAEEVHRFAPERFSFRCNCSRERTASMLLALGSDELRETADEHGDLHVDCEFCGHRYTFDSIDIAGLLAGCPPDACALRH